MTGTEEEATLIELGVIARPQGLTGELRVHVYNPESTLLEGLGEVFLLSEDDPTPSLVDVVSARRGPKALLMRLAGVDSREDAESLRGFVLAVPRQALPALDEGEFYHADLIGLVAYEGERAVGPVLEVIDYPSVECLRVETTEGFLEIPLIAPWLDRVDIEAGKIHVKALEEIPVQKGR
ncbi:MAG: ribosome maturation factor RimM [Polyangiales bacterium]